MQQSVPTLFTCLSPALMHLYEVKDTIVVVIDILRATSTITTALHNGASSVIPVLNVPDCIEIGKADGCITAGERDGQIAPGLAYGNSPFEYTRDFVENKTLVLTTTNGTRLLHMALEKGAAQIVIGSFCNLDVVCKYLIEQNKNVILGCAAWKDRVNIEDSLFAGAVVESIKTHFSINCDATHIAENMYLQAKDDLFAYMKNNEASHYKRLSGYGLEKDIAYCLQSNTCPIVPVYIDGKLIPVN